MVLRYYRLVPLQHCEPDALPQREDYWIRTLHKLIPHGLNSACGNLYYPNDHSLLPLSPSTIETSSAETLPLPLEYHLGTLTPHSILCHQYHLSTASPNLMHMCTPTIHSCLEKSLPNNASPSPQQQITPRTNTHNPYHPEKHHPSSHFEHSFCITSHQGHLSKKVLGKSFFTTDN